MKRFQDNHDDSQPLLIRLLWGSCSQTQKDQGWSIYPASIILYADVKPGAMATTSGSRKQLWVSFDIMNWFCTLSLSLFSLGPPSNIFLESSIRTLHLLTLVLMLVIEVPSGKVIYAFVTTFLFISVNDTNFLIELTSTESSLTRIADLQLHSLRPKLCTGLIF